jgi:hypothetical protein
MTHDERMWKLLHSDEARELQRDIARAVERYYAFGKWEICVNLPRRSDIRYASVSVDWPLDN